MLEVLADFLYLLGRTRMPRSLQSIKMEEITMRNLLLASAAALLLAAQPVLADSLTETTGGADAKTGAEPEALPPPAAVLPEGVTTATETVGNAAAAAQTVIDGAALIGKTVVDASGEAVGTVSNAVLAPNSNAAEKVVIESGGLFGFGAREVAIDASNVDASAANEGKVRLIGLTAADLDVRREFEANESMRLANPS
jgi:sporulation protein YlmC with PRC-barrel domain